MVCGSAQIWSGDAAIFVSTGSAFECLVGVTLCVVASVGCVPASPDEPVDAGREVGVDSEGADCEPLPYARELVSFESGEGAGHGQSDLPEVVLGPPSADRNTTSQSTDVLSLGEDGTIVLGFGGCQINDGEGDDFVVFENPFYVGGDPENVYAELGEVAVSVDGESWKTFECDVESTEPGRWPGCAGWRPTRQFDPEGVDPPDPAVTGGNAFDLADVGLDRANYVRIRDLEGKGSASNTGFDLDAVGIVHPAP